MTRLTAITATAWTPIATRVPAGAVDAWDWHLTPHDQVVFRMTQAAGHLATAQRRDATGRFVLLARRVARAAENSGGVTGWGAPGSIGVQASGGGR